MNVFHVKAWFVDTSLKLNRKVSLKIIMQINNFRIYTQKNSHKRIQTWKPLATAGKSTYPECSACKKLTTLHE